MKEASLDHLSRIIQLKGIPFSVVFEITDRCNLKCLHCYQENGEKEELSFREIKVILDDLEKLGTMKVTLTGGEPLLKILPRYSFTVPRKDLQPSFLPTPPFSIRSIKKPFLRSRLLRWNVVCMERQLKHTNPLPALQDHFEKTLANIKWMAEKGIRVFVKSVSALFKLPRDGGP